jgi:hypothetical protein
MKEGEFKLLEKGTNSEIFLYGGNVVLKMVDVGCGKQSQVPQLQGKHPHRWYGIQIIRP